MGTSYLSPGVYIQEVDTVQPIEGVSTSVTGFVGLTQMGPLDTNPPVLVTSLADYQRTFGGYFNPQFSSTPPLGGEAGYNFLPHAVAGFFNNGGQVLYIKRVAASVANGGTAPASAQLGTLENNVGTPTLTTTLSSTAIPSTSGGTLYLANMRGIQNGTTLVLSQTKNGVTTTSGSITVESYNDGSQSVNVNSIPAPSPAAANFTNYDWQYTTVQLTGVTGINGAGTALAPAPNTSEFQLQASSPGAWGSNILVQITPSSRGSAQVINLGNYGSGTDNLLVLNSAANMYAGAIIELNTGGTFTVAGTLTGALTAGELVTQPGTGASATFISEAAGVMTLGPITGGPPNGTDWQDSSGTNKFTPSTPTTLPALVQGGKYYAKIASIQGSGIVLVETPDAGIFGTAIPTVQAAIAAGIRIAVRTCEFNIAASYNNTNENWTGLTLDNTTPYYYATTINNNSNLLSVPTTGGVLPFDIHTQDPSTMPVSQYGGVVNMTPLSGTDGSVPVALDFVGNDGGPGNRTGIAALIDAAEISIIAAPGITDQNTQMALIDQCELLKYRFAILDPAPTSTGGSPGIPDIQKQRNLYDTHYAAIYYPGVVVTDPLSGNPLTISPSGHIAGIYAQTDATRGVWKAPANVVINGILNLATKLSKGDQDVLNPEPNNINALRDFTAQGRGLRVYGARCITTDIEWMYINVRRLFIYLEDSLDQGTQWAVFEPNNPALWARLTQSVEAFLTTVWQAGGLMGATAAQAFFVKCDLTTMSLDDRENGRLIMQIGVAPVFPAEFVIIQIGQWQGGSSVQEL
jgi:phage tail sheath protein FI